MRRTLMIALALATATVATAADNNVGRIDDRMNEWVDCLSDATDATEAQQDQMSGMLDTYNAEFQPMVDAGRATRQAIKDLKGQKNQEAADEKRAELEQLQRQKRVLKDEFKADLQGVLTSEQLEVGRTECPAPSMRKARADHRSK